MPLALSALLAVLLLIVTGCEPTPVTPTEKASPKVAAAQPAPPEPTAQEKRSAEKRNIVNGQAREILKQAIYGDDIQIDVVSYASAIDGTAPLYANFVYPKGAAKKLPILVFMHGYNNNRSNRLDEQVKAAQMGFFVIAPDMRERGTKPETFPYSTGSITPFPQLMIKNAADKYLENLLFDDKYSRRSEIAELKKRIRARAQELFDDKLAKGELKNYQEQYTRSAGEADDGAVEIHDIYDAVEHAKSEYAHVVNQDKVAAVGFSGGGGSVYSLITKFPDAFQYAAPFFGIADYAYWFHYAQGSFRPYFQKAMIENIGGAPREVPDRYAARNSLDGVVNNPYTKIHLFWDETEIQCPVYFNLSYAQKAKDLGYDNVFAHETGSDINCRALHRAPLTWNGWNCLEAHLKEIAAAPANPQKLKEKGRMTVLGYLRTKPFFVMFNDGRDAVADLEYDLTDPLRFSFRKRSGPDATRGVLRVKTPLPIEGITENGQPFSGWKREGKEIVLTGISPDASYQLATGKP